MTDTSKLLPTFTGNVEDWPVFERKSRARHVASGRARWLKRTAISADIPPADGAEGDAPYDEM
jgi:hypothetical protein